MKQKYVLAFSAKWEQILQEEIKKLEAEGFKQVENEGRFLTMADASGKKVYPADLATETFEEVCNAEEVVGYYISYHREDALYDWVQNTYHLTLSEQDKEVDRILRELYPVTEEQKILLCNLYNGSDLEALEYIKFLCTLEQREQLNRLLALNAEGVEELSKEEFTEYHKGKWELLNSFGIKDKGGNTAYYERKGDN